VYTAKFIITKPGIHFIVLSVIFFTIIQGNLTRSSIEV